MKSIIYPLVKLAGILSIFGISSCSIPSLPVASPAAAVDSRRELTERVQNQMEPAVLFVGNSYSFGVPKAFATRVAAGGRKVIVGHSTFGGWTLERHAGSEMTLRKIRERHWDVVVFQEHSEIPALPSRKRASLMVSPLLKLVNEARKQGAIPVLYQTWGRRDGDKNVAGDDFHSMMSRLREGYQAAADDAGGLVVVPAGDAWEREVSAGRGARLFMDDGSHPSPLGNELTAEVFYETLFGK